MMVGLTMKGDQSNFEVQPKFGGETIHLFKTGRGALVSGWRYLTYFLSKPKQFVAVFIHIPKCAGTTVSNVARRNYHPGRVFDYTVRGRRATDGTALSFNSTESPDITKITEFMGENAGKINCVLGHLPFGIDEFFERRVYYFTFVRNPVSRVWLQFNHFINQDSHYLHPILRKYDYDLVKILRSGEVFELCNDQSRMLLGESKVVLGEDAVERAKRHVEEYIDFVAPVEKFNSGIKQLADKLGWVDTAYSRQNKGRYKKLPPEPDRMTKQAIEEHNQVDLALYEFVLERWKGV